MIADLFGVRAMYKFSAHVLYPNLVGGWGGGGAGHAGTWQPTLVYVRTVTRTYQSGFA